MRKLLSFGVLALAGCCFWGEGENGAVSAVSPDGRNEIRLWTNPLAYEVRRGGTVVVAKSEIGMKVDGKCLNCGGEDAPAPIVDRSSKIRCRSFGRGAASGKTALNMLAAVRAEGRTTPSERRRDSLSMGR